MDRSPDDYIQEIRQQNCAHQTSKLSNEDKANKRLAKTQKHLEKHTHYRKEKYTEIDGGKAHRKNKRRFLSNSTHMSTTDPDARIVKKSNKPRMLCYSAMMAVDSKLNLITHMSAERAHQKDSRYLINTTRSTVNRLDKLGLEVDTILADEGFSSGENYATMKELNLDTFISIHGTYKENREGFAYNRAQDRYDRSMPEA